MSRSFTESSRGAATAVLRAIALAAGLALAADAIAAPRAGAPVTSADGGDLKLRIEKLEKQLSSQGLLNLLQQLQNLQTELGRLRGELEVHNHSIEQLRKAQRDLYNDLDQRLQRLEGGGAPADAAGLDAEAEPLPASAPPLEDLAAAPPVPENPAGEQGSALTVETVDTAARQAAPAVPDATAPAAPASESDPFREQAQYQAAFKLLKDAHYDQAIKSFGDFLNGNPHSELADNAQYWLGEAYYVTQDYPNALAAYERLITTYPSSLKIADAMLKAAYSQQELGQVDQARARLEEVRKRYPGSTAARFAEERLKKIGSATPAASGRAMN